MPVFDMIETLLVKKLKFTPCFRLRFITRTTYVGKRFFSKTLSFSVLNIKGFVNSCGTLNIAAFTMIVAMAIPFFGGLLGFFGGFAFAPTSYYVRKILSSLCDKLQTAFHCLPAHIIHICLLQSNQIFAKWPSNFFVASMHYLACPLQTQKV